MCADAAVSDVLACVLDRGDEGTFGESAIVGVIGRDANSVSVTQSLELNLGVHRLLGVRRRLEVYVALPGMAVANQAAQQ